MDRRGDPDLLLLRHLPGSDDFAGELQQIQVQLLQVSPLSTGRLGVVVAVTSESNSCHRRLREKEKEKKKNGNLGSACVH